MDVQRRASWISRFRFLSLLLLRLSYVYLFGVKGGMRVKRFFMAIAAGALLASGVALADEIEGLVRRANDSLRIEVPGEAEIEKLEAETEPAAHNDISAKIVGDKVQLFLNDFPIGKPVHMRYEMGVVWSWFHDAIYDIELHIKKGEAE